MLDAAKIAQLGAKVENTPELQVYWQNRFAQLLTQQKFLLGNKSAELLESDTTVNKPATTFGDLDLLKFTNDKGELDETELQTGVETAVRLLDNLLDAINFSEDAKFIVNQYRKIGLGVENFREYAEIRKNTSELDEIDYVGNLISGSAYRASESIAEEKGVPAAWEKIKTHLRPKSFEYWYNLDSGEIRNGLEMTEDWNQVSVKTSKFEVVPRRNSHILLFPPDLEWQIWSDRDDTTPKTEFIQPQTSAVKTPEPAPTTQEVDLLSPTPAEHIVEVVSENSQPLPEVVTTAPVPDAGLKAPEKIEEVTLPQFQIGELVKVSNPEAGDYNKVFQVVEASLNSPFTYTLVGRENEDGFIRPESDLEAVDLFQILDKINLPKPEVKPETKICVLGFILNEDGQLLVEQNGSEIKLPGGEIQHNSIPEQSLLQTLSENYGLKTKIVQDLGSSVSLASEQNPYTLYLGFLLESEGKNENLSWVDSKSVEKLPPYARVLLNKHNRQQIAGQNSTQKLSALQQKINVLQSEKAELQTKVEQLAAAPKPTVETAARASNFSITPITDINRTMSKYALKLEQLVQTNTFGDVTVTIQYDSEGPKVVSAGGEKLTPELKHLIDTILVLVNFSLTKKVAPKELATVLENEPKDGVHLPINDFLKVIAASLKDAPESAGNIDPNILGKVLPEALMDIVNKGENKTVPPSDKPENQPKENGGNQPQESKGGFNPFAPRN